MDAALFQEPRRRMIPLADGEMAAVEFGDPARGVDVVFLHANGFNAMTYRTLLGPLSFSMRILALDLRGHGSTRLPADPAEPRRSWSLFRKDLMAVLKTLPGPAPLLAGHSMGATVALMAAADDPGCTRGLVLFEPVVLSPLADLMGRAPWTAGRSWRRIPLARNAARRRAVFDDPAEAFRSYEGRGAFRTWPSMVLADYLSGGLKERPDGKVELACDPAWEAANFAAQDNRAAGALRRLQAPAAIYRGDQGSTCAVKRSFNPAIRVTTVAGASHFLPMEHPGLAREALLDAVEP